MSDEQKDATKKLREFYDSTRRQFSLLRLCQARLKGTKRDFSKPTMQLRTLMLGIASPHERDQIRAGIYPSEEDLFCWIDLYLADPEHMAGGKSVEPPKAPAKGSARTPSKSAAAVAVLWAHPDWTNARIAQEVGCRRNSLNRMRDFTDARAALRSARNAFPSGSKDGANGDVEAWDNPEDAEG